jgi:hypothetical protein
MRLALLLQARLPGSKPTACLRYVMRPALPLQTRVTREVSLDGLPTPSLHAYVCKASRLTSSNPGSPGE